MVQRLYSRCIGFFLALSCATSFTLAFAAAGGDVTQVQHKPCGAMTAAGHANCTQPINGSATPDSTRLYGTVCSKGTFDCKIAPSYTKLSAFRDRTKAKLEQHTLSIPLAVQAQNDADHVRELLDSAVRQCALVKQKCTGDQKAAEKSLAQANAALKKLAG
jgi:hypothetical protein